MKTTTLAFMRTAAIWLAFAVIAVIYLFGVAAMKVVDFVSHESFGSVCERVLAAGTGTVDFRYHGWILAGAFVAVVLHTVLNLRLRMVIAAICVTAPWFWTTSGIIKGTAGWILVMPATPLWTLGMIGSGADGEFYCDGLAVGVAAGWWMVLWSIIGWADFLKLRREPKNAAPEKPERRFENQAYAFRQGPGASP
jgi:hypothetical protein